MSKLMNRVNVPRVRSGFTPRVINHVHLNEGIPIRTRSLASHASLPKLTVLDDPLIGNSTLAPFMVSTTRGFLPREDPIFKLPPRFEVLDDLLNRMTIRQPDGSAGLLAKGLLGQTVLRELPLIETDDITDMRILNALYRDYSWLVSAYLLEPCDISFRTTGEYGLGRDVLPKNIAVPFSKVAQRTGFKNFMEYAGSYALYNYKRKDPNLGLHYENIELIRKFEGSSSEHGFIAVHVAMVAESGPLVKSTMDTLKACENQDRTAFNKAMIGVLTAYQKINAIMETMWTRSKPEDYIKFRTFIFGTKSQPMFPNGVLYEGVSNEPTFYRGESGANDSIVPTGDNLLEITSRMPETPLTEILRDFRTYRPSNHKEFLEYVYQRAQQAGVREFSYKDNESKALYFLVLDQLRDFRWRHYMFSTEYILKHTKHPRATGGSPIVTWLPNQLGAILRAMEEIADQGFNAISSMSSNIDSILIGQSGLWQQVETATTKCKAQRRALEREVARLSKERGNAATEAEI